MLAVAYQGANINGASMTPRNLQSVACVEDLGEQCNCSQIVLPPLLSWFLCVLPAPSFLGCQHRKRWRQFARRGPYLVSGLLGSCAVGWLRKTRGPFHLFANSEWPCTCLWAVPMMFPVLAIDCHRMSSSVFGAGRLLCSGSASW